MYYTQWVEKVWGAICAQAQKGPAGQMWNNLVSDQMLDALDATNIQSLPAENQHHLLWAIDQVGVLLEDKMLYTLRERNRIELSARGRRFLGISPLSLWPEMEMVKQLAAFLSKIARRQIIEGPDEHYLLVQDNPPVNAKELFEELGWPYSERELTELTKQLLRLNFIIPKRTVGGFLIRLTPKGALYAAMVEQ